MNTIYLYKISLNIDGNKSNYNIYSMSDLYYHLNKIELISNIKLFNESIIFKDVFKNYVIVKFDDKYQLINFIRWFKSNLILKFKFMDDNKKIKFMNNYYKFNYIDKYNLNYNLNKFIQSFFIDDNINHKNTKLFLNVLLH